MTQDDDFEALLPDGSRCEWDERLTTVGALRVRKAGRGAPRVPRYRVDVVDWERGSFRRCSRRAFADLGHAQHYVGKALRRGVVRHGGTIKRDNWGGTAGAYGPAYRTATIYMQGTP